MLQSIFIISIHIVNSQPHTIVCVCVRVCVRACVRECVYVSVSVRA